MTETPYVTETQLRTSLRQQVALARCQNDYADTHGIDRGWLSRVLTGKRRVGVRVAALLGYAPIQVYQPQGGEDAPGL